MYLKIDILQQNLKQNLRKRQEIKKIQKLSKKIPVYEAQKAEQLN